MQGLNFNTELPPTKYKSIQYERAKVEVSIRYKGPAQDASFY